MKGKSAAVRAWLAWLSRAKARGKKRKDDAAKDAAKDAGKK